MHCPSSASRGPILTIAALTGLHVALFMATTAPIDDAAITYAYAHQAADGHPLGTVIPGDPVGEGWSNPTWMALEWTGEQLGIGAHTTARGLGLVLAVATAAALAATVLRIEPGRRTARLALLLAFAFVPAIWAASGLENPLVGVLVVATALLIAREERTGARGWRSCGSAVLATALALSRPEAPLYLVAAAVAKGWSIRTQRRADAGTGPPWSDLLRWLAVGGALVVAYLAWHVRRFGFLFPNPVYAKASEGSILERLGRALNPVGPTWRATFRFAAERGLLWLAPSVVLGVLALRRRPERSLLVLTAAALGLPLAEADWMDHHRFYSTAAWPLTAMAVLGTVELLRRREAASADAARRYRMILAFGLVAYLLFNVAATALIASNGNAPGVTTLDIATTYRRVAALGDRFGITDPLLLAPDAGATVHQLETRFLDAAGLLDTQVAHELTDADRLQQYGFVERRPDLVFLHTDYARLWRLDTDRLVELGYLPVPYPEEEDVEILLVAVRRDHLVSTEGEAPLLAPELAEAGGTVTVRGTWPATLVGEPLRVEVRDRTGEVLASTDGTVGDEVVDQEHLDAGELVRSVTLLDLPRDLADGPVEVVAAAGDVEQQAAIRIGPVTAVPAAADDPATALVALHDLGLAAPGATDAVDAAAETVRRDGLERLRRDASEALEAGDAEALEEVARTAAFVRGRHDPGADWRAIADAALAQGGGDGYLWARAAQLADPTSIDAARRLLGTRP